jgi:ABC-type xylose transport system permease subunit
MLALAVVAGLALGYTRFGRHVFAIGSNEQAARVCGIAINRVKVTVYTLAAALAGVAGVMQFSRLTVGDPTVAAGLELDMIAAVVWHDLSCRTAVVHSTPRTTRGTSVFAKSSPLNSSGSPDVAESA